MDEEGLRRVDLVQHLDVADRVVRHGRGQVPGRISHVWIDGGGVAEQVRLPLARVAADEPVEVLEAQADRPAIEWTGLAGLEGRRVVVLAEPGSGVAVVPEDAADGRRIPLDDAVVAGVAGRQLGDDAEARRMVVAAGDERGPRRRAERGGVELGVAQPGVRDAVQRRRGDDSAEGARRAEADVVGHDEKDVGRALRRDDAGRPPGLRLVGVDVDLAAELRGRRGELPPVDGRGRAGRARHAGDLLGAGREAREQQRKGSDERREGRENAHGCSPGIALARGRRARLAERARLGWTGTVPLPRGLENRILGARIGIRVRGPTGGRTARTGPSTVNPSSRRARHHGLMSELIGCGVFALVEMPGIHRHSTGLRRCSGPSAPRCPCRRRWWGETCPRVGPRVAAAGCRSRQGFRLWESRLRRGSRARYPDSPLPRMRRAGWSPEPRGHEGGTAVASSYDRSVCYRFPPCERTGRPLRG